MRRRMAGGTFAAAALSAGALFASTLSFAPPASAVGSSGKSLTIITEHVPKVGTVLATKSGLTLYRTRLTRQARRRAREPAPRRGRRCCCRRASRHIKAPHGVKGLTRSSVSQVGACRCSSTTRRSTSS